MKTFLSFLKVLTLHKGSDIGEIFLLCLSLPHLSYEFHEAMDPIIISGTGEANQANNIVIGSVFPHHGIVSTGSLLVQLCILL